MKIISKKTVLTPLFITAVLSLLFVSGCTTFPGKVKNAQKEIENSFQTLGYSPRDVIDFDTIKRERDGQKWFQRNIVFKDHEDKTWKELHQYFAHDAPYNFDCELAVGESESDIQKIRWFEFKLDKFYTIYRIEFRRRIIPNLDDVM